MLIGIRNSLEILTHILHAALHHCTNYKDTSYYMWRQRRLPSNVDPLNSNLKSKLERDRIARIFETGLIPVLGTCCR